MSGEYASGTIRASLLAVPTRTPMLAPTAAVFGALIFVAIARPPLRQIRGVDIPALLGLGVTSGLTTFAFLGAIERIPLGTAVAIEFLGPLTVAAVRSSSSRTLVWP